MSKPLNIIWAPAAICLAAGVLLSACASADPSPQPQAAVETPVGPDVRIAGGLALAQRACAACHAVEAGADSPRPMAPPFPQLAARLSGPRLEESLTMVSDLGHGEMPPARLEQAELRDLAVYIDSLD